jgi:hypothetical protein
MTKTLATGGDSLGTQSMCRSGLVLAVALTLDRIWVPGRWAFPGPSKRRWNINRQKLVSWPKSYRWKANITAASNVVLMSCQKCGSEGFQKPRLRHIFPRPH